ncbi:MAG: 30S ribosome-binding factor RbfA [Desulfobulbaceae bacterium]|nr:30S ribosome-binding factor RbfA [Desulfobulbaceae bacterium]
MGFDFTLPGLGKPESSRPKRVAEAIKNELSILLLQKVRDPRLQDVSISRVEITPDLKHAKVYIIVAGDKEWSGVRKGLEKAKGFFRSQLAARMNLRYTPELAFFHDKHFEETKRLDEIFREIAKDKKSDEDAA